MSLLLTPEEIRDIRDKYTNLHTETERVCLEEGLNAGAQAQLDKVNLAHQEEIQQAISTAIGAYESTCEALIAEARKKERERVCNYLQDLIELSSKVQEKVIRVGMSNILQALKGEG